MATEEEVNEQALQETYTKIGDDTIRNYSPQGVFRIAFLAGRESAIPEIIELINRYWSFDESQRHTHSWHDKQDLLEILYKRIGQSK